MKQIAIIDDDIYISSMLEELLVREGYGVLRAYSGTEALLLLEEKKPDLVLLDLMLPGLRIAVQLRRTVPAASPLLRYGPLVLNTAARSVTAKGREVRLTRTEYAVLKLLMQNPRQVVTKGQLLDHISEDTPDCVESSLKVHVSNLRRKLREAGAGECIESVWGIGFKLAERAL